MQKKKRKTKGSKKEEWYSARGLFKHIYENKNTKDKYEDAVFILKAGSDDEAEDRAIEIFNEYADDDIGIVFKGHYEICRIYDSLKAGSQVFWSMRISRLSPKRFVEKYWDEGRPDSCDQKGWTHVWHNIDNKNSGCYNCKEIRKGQLWKKNKQ